MMSSRLVVGLLLICSYVGGSHHDEVFGTQTFELNAIFSKSRPASTSKGQARIARLDAIVESSAAEGDAVAQNPLPKAQTAEKTFRDIRNTLAFMGPKDEASRRYLVKYAAVLDVPVSEKVKLIHEDLAKYASFPGNKERTLGPLVDFETLMNLTTDRGILVQELRIVMKSYQNTLSGKEILARFKEHYPDEAEEFL